jgi:hypothetical protein
MLPSTIRLCTTCLEERGEKLDRGGQIERRPLIGGGGSELGIGRRRGGRGLGKSGGWEPIVRVSSI